MSEKIQMYTILQTGCVVFDPNIGFLAILPRSKEIVMVVSAMTGIGIPV